MTKLKLFLRSLVISSTTIGGGFVIISVVRSLYVDKLKILSEDDMLELTSLAQSAPGAVAINLSIILGYKLCGLPGALVSLLGTFLPPFVIMSLIAALYGFLGEFRYNETVSEFMSGMQIGVSVVILDAALKMTASVFHEKSVFKYIIFFCAVILQLCFSVSSVYIVSAAIIIGIVSSVITGVKEKHGIH